MVHSRIWDWYRPSRRSTPAFPPCGAASCSATTRARYSALNERRTGRAAGSTTAYAGPATERSAEPGRAGTVLLTRLSPVTPYTVDPGLRGVSAQPDSEGQELPAAVSGVAVDGPRLRPGVRLRLGLRHVVGGGRRVRRRPRVGAGVGVEQVVDELLGDRRVPHVARADLGVGDDLAVRVDREVTIIATVLALGMTFPVAQLAAPLKRVWLIVIMIVANCLVIPAAVWGIFKASGMQDAYVSGATSWATGNVIP